jgi:hypothetical protein
MRLILIIKFGSGRPLAAPAVLSEQLPEPLPPTGPAITEGLKKSPPKETLAAEVTRLPMGATVLWPKVIVVPVMVSAEVYLCPSICFYTPDFYSENGWRDATRLIDSLTFHFSRCDGLSIFFFQLLHQNKKINVPAC